jgi:hypothetical protein
MAAVLIGPTTETTTTTTTHRTSQASLAFLKGTASDCIGGKTRFAAGVGQDPYRCTGDSYTPL